VLSVLIGGKTMEMISKKQEEHNVTVDDLVPVIEELRAGVLRLEAVLKEHEHLPSGKAVIKL